MATAGFDLSDMAGMDRAAEADQIIGPPNWAFARQLRPTQTSSRMHLFNNWVFRICRSICLSLDNSLRLDWRCCHACYPCGVSYHGSGYRPSRLQLSCPRPADTAM